MKVNESGKNQYTTSDIQSLYGMSNKGLFYYEEKGLITPKRSAGSNYRIYMLEETSKIHRCRVYRKFGFSVEESIDMVIGCDANALCDSLYQRKKEIQQEIAWSSLIAEQIDDNINAVQRIAHGEIPYMLCMRPSMYRVSLRDDGEVYSEEAANLYAQWQEYLPLANASLMIYQDSLDASGDDLHLNFGFSIHMDYVDRLHIAPPSGSVQLPCVPCLYTILRGPESPLTNKSRIQGALDWIESHGYRLCGNPLLLMLTTLDAGCGMERFDHAWFPIQKKKE